MESASEVQRQTTDGVAVQGDAFVLGRTFASDLRTSSPSTLRAERGNLLEVPGPEIEEFLYAGTGVEHHEEKGVVPASSGTRAVDSVEHCAHSADREHPDRSS